MERNRKKPGIWLMRSGVLLIVTALFLTGYNVKEEDQAGKEAARIISELPVEPKGPKADETPDYTLSPDLEMPFDSIEGNSYIGVLELPSLGLALPVLKEWSYPNLRIAPCRYTGSVYKENMVIAGHNYSTHFGHLKGLVPGDPILFMDVDGNVFHYKVVKVEILGPTEIERMTEGDWPLTLFTCTLGGRSRVTVRCENVKGEEK